MTRAALSCGSTGNYDKGHRMAIVESLLSTAYEDTQLLTKLDQDGDRFSIARDVDFVLKTEEFNPTCAVLRIGSDDVPGSAFLSRLRRLGMRCPATSRST
jgi:hypothetical protein